MIFLRESMSLSPASAASPDLAPDQATSTSRPLLPEEARAISAGGTAALSLGTLDSRMELDRRIAVDRVYRK